MAMEGTEGAGRYPCPIHRRRIAAANMGEIGRRRAACPHVILDMDLEEVDVRIRFHDCSVMLGLQADAGTGRNRPVTSLTIELERHDEVPHIGRRSAGWRRRTAAGGGHRPPAAKGRTR